MILTKVSQVASADEAELCRLHMQTGNPLPFMSAQGLSVLHLFPEHFFSCLTLLCCSSLTGPQIARLRQGRHINVASKATLMLRR